MHHSAQQPFFKALIFYMDGVFADSDPKSLPQSLLAVFPSTAVFKTPACGAPPISSPLLRSSYPGRQPAARQTARVPPWGVRYIHYYGLYSSRCKARWQAWPHILRAAPRGWRQSHMDPMPAQADATEPTTVPHAACRSAWARLIAKVYEVDLAGGSWPRNGQREPHALSPVWLRDEAHRAHHRSP